MVGAAVMVSERFLADKNSLSSFLRCLDRSQMDMVKETILSTMPKKVSLLEKVVMSSFLSTFLN